MEVLVESVISFSDRYPLLALYGFRDLNEIACRAIAAIANGYEEADDEWAVMVLAGSQRTARRMMGEIGLSLRSPARGGDLFLRTKNGKVHILPSFPDLAQEIIQGLVGHNIIWLVDEHASEDALDAILASVCKGVRIIALNPPENKTDLFVAFWPGDR